MIALSWIQADSSKWKPFVANRVTLRIVVVSVIIIKIIINLFKQSNTISDIINLKALRITGWVLRFVNNLKTARSQRTKCDLSYNELVIEKTNLFKFIQLQAYPEEMTALKQKSRVHKTSKIAQLSP